MAKRLTKAERATNSIVQTYKAAKQVKERTQQKLDALFESNAFYRVFDFEEKDKHPYHHLADIAKQVADQVETLVAGIKDWQIDQYTIAEQMEKIKAEQYLKDVMNKYRNKIVYDSNTGEIRDDRKFMSMLEDFWLPRREGGRGTEITTLPGGENLGQIDDINYFKNKLYQALNVPISRLEPSSGMNFGRAAEITRDELKFGKFIDRLRKRFSDLFQDIF